MPLTRWLVVNLGLPFNVAVVDAEATYVH